MRKETDKELLVEKVVLKRKPSVETLVKELKAVDYDLLKFTFAKLLPTLTAKEIDRFIISSPDLITELNIGINDLERAKELIKVSPMSYQYLKSKELKESIELIEVALISFNIDTFEEKYDKINPLCDSIPENVVLEREFILKHLAYKPELYSRLSEEDQNSKTLALLTVSKEARGYIFISEKFKTDLDILKLVVGNMFLRSLAFKEVEYIFGKEGNGHLRNNKDLIRAAVENDRGGMSLFNLELLKDREFFIELMHINLSVFFYTDEHAKDSIIADLATDINPTRINCLPDSFRGNKNFIVEALDKIDKGVLNPKINKKSKQLVFKFMSLELKHDSEFVSKYFSINTGTQNRY